MPRLFLLVGIAAIAFPASAQVAPSPFNFGSADDPVEAPPGDVRAPAARVDAFGGPSYIGVAWRSGVGFEMDAAAGAFSLGLGGRLHVGGNGVYDPDTDETYDLVRLVRYARFDPVGFPVYARVGPVERITFGSGHLVRAFQTTTAWDERTVGAEVAARLPFAEIAGFADDVRLGGLVGGRATVTPLRFASRPRLSSVQIGVTAVTDLGLPSDTATTAFGVDARLALLRLGDFALSPFVSYARFTEYGDGYGAGVSFGGEELAGLGRLGVTLGFFQSSDRFIPGYFNSFYPVRNPEAQILNADAFFRNTTADQTVGTPLSEAKGGTAVFFAFRVLFFNGFELSTYARRAYGGDALSEGSLRLAVAPGSGEALRFVFEVQRQGRTSFLDLFSDFEDQNVLVFHLDYALPGPARLYVRSRYGYTRVDDTESGEERYLVERRFEPFVGVRLLLR